MKKSAKFLALVLVLIMALFLTGCAKKEEEKKVYTALTNATYPPMDTVDEEGNIVGFDMDLLNAIAEDQGFEVTYVDMAFDALIPALEAGNGDIIASSIGIMPERLERIDMLPYYTGYTCLVTRIDEENIKTLDDLTAEHKAATQIASNFAVRLEDRVAEGKLGEAVLLDGFNECILQLQNGNVDAVFTSLNVAQSFVKDVGKGKIKVAGTVDGNSVGLGFRKDDDELYAMVEAGLNNVMKSGKYKEIADKWGVALLDE